MDNNALSQKSYHLSTLLIFYNFSTYLYIFIDCSITLSWLTLFLTLAQLFA